MRNREVWSFSSTIATWPFIYFLMQINFMVWSELSPRSFLKKKIKKKPHGLKWIISTLLSEKKVDKCSVEIACLPSSVLKKMWWDHFVFLWNSPTFLEVSSKTCSHGLGIKRLINLMYFRPPCYTTRNYCS
jgi:hypothetical protein